MHSNTFAGLVGRISGRVENVKSGSGVSPGSSCLQNLLKNQVDGSMGTSCDSLIRVSHKRAVRIAVARSRVHGRCVAAVGLRTGEGTPFGISADGRLC